MLSSTEHEQESSFIQLCCSLIGRTAPSSTRENTIVANATTKKVNELDTKTFPKQDGRNGKLNQQKVHVQVRGSLKTHLNQGCHD